SAERVVSPYDVDARCSRKRETDWFGFKSQMTESCSPEEPLHLIVYVATTLATTPDVEQTAPTLQRVREQGLEPIRITRKRGKIGGMNKQETKKRERERSPNNRTTKGVRIHEH